MAESDFIAPLNPTGAQGLLRNALVKRVIYAIADSENPEDFEALDGETGAMPIGLGYQGRIFWLDASDTTTAHDGVSCIVTADSYRYKTEDIRGRPLSVLTRSEDEQPETPSIGDAYLIPAGATGADWASKPDYIGLFTARGWMFVAPRVGLLVYVEDEDGYYHYDTAGDWVPGIGASAIPDGSVSPAALIGERSHWVVVNQSTNDPPGSPSEGVFYVVGPAPTGDWAGQTGKIASFEAGAWAFYTPAEGWEIYDQALNTNYVYRAGWVSKASGYAAVSEPASLTSTAVSLTGSSSSGYSYSASTPPTSTQNGRWADPMAQSFAAGNPSAELEIVYEACLGLSITTQASSSSAASVELVVALFVDSETNARDWRKVGRWDLKGSNSFDEDWSPDPFVGVTFRTAVTDSASHTYRVQMLFLTSVATGGSVSIGNATRRHLIIRERA